MRKNTARHWLHATLDLLPVILIPVFMIYSHRHDLSTDITVQVDDYKDFYQYVENGQPTSIDGWGLDDDSYGQEVNYINNEIEIDTSAEDTNFYYGFTYDISLYSSSKYYISFYMKSDINGSLFNLSIGDFPSITLSDNLTQEYVRYSILTNPSDNDVMPSLFFELSGNLDLIYIKNAMFFDVTSIFGSGNEPTKEVFESYLTQDYYDYGSNQVKVGTTSVAAKNNDIMSVFMDSFNNSVNKYFNMGNVFNMTSVYNWFNTNIFGGTAPIVIYSVWNIVLYEFVMDLLFLLYALFMWFIDMLKRLIEKPLDSIK